MADIDNNTPASAPSSKVKGGRKDYIDPWELSAHQISQQAAGYSPYGAADGRGCAACQFFISPDDCVEVDGDVSPTGICGRFFAAVPASMGQPIPVTVVDPEDYVAGEAQLSDKHGAGKKGLGATLIERLFSAVGLGGSEEPEPGSFGLKELDNGRLRFFCDFSNNFEDREGETFIGESHEEFVAYSKSTEQYPDLWYWHLKPSKFGQVDTMHYDGNFVSASGLIDEGKEDFARAVAASKGLAMSHGYIAARKGTDYQRYRSYEISVLPAEFAANLGTGWHLGGEMRFRPEMRADLREKGLSEDTINAWEKDHESFVKLAEAFGLKSKEVFVEDETPAPPAQTDALTEERVAQLIDEKLGELTVAVKALGEKFATTDDAGAALFESRVGQLRQGFQASTSDETLKTGQKSANLANDRYSWVQNSPLTRPILQPAEGVN